MSSAYLKQSVDCGGSCNGNAYIRKTLIMQVNGLVGQTEEVIRQSYSETNIYSRLPYDVFKLMEGKAPRKHSLHKKEPWLYLSCSSVVMKDTTDAP